MGRTELLSALFFLLSLLSYLQLLATQDRRQSSLPPPLNSVLWLTFAVGFSVLSLISKEQGITVLGVCLAYDVFIAAEMNLGNLIKASRKMAPFSVSFWQRLLWAPVASSRFVSVLKRALLLVGSAVLILSLRLYINGRGSPLFVESDNPASFSAYRLTRVLTYMHLCSVNLWLLLFPSRLCFDWSMGSIPLVESLADSRNLFTLLSSIVFGAVVMKAG